MLIKVRIIPSAKKCRIVEDPDRIKVYVTQPPVDGKANKALVDLLAERFKVKKNQVKIVKGEKGRDKVVEIG